MDHYPPVVKPRDPVEVPYYGGEYDNEDFAGYPARRGIDVEALKRGDSQNLSQDHVAEFLQTWFFFGMIRDFVEVDIAVADFVKSDDAGNRFLTTKKLLIYLGQWRARIERAAAAVDEQQRRELATARELRIESLLMASFKHWRAFRPDDADSLMDPRMSLCLQLLGSVMEFSCSWPGFLFLNGNQTPWRFSRSPWLTRRMVERGWCPATCERLHSPGDLPVQYYASLLEPPGFGSSPTGPELHRDCVNHYLPCRANNINPSTYKTLHADHGCQCEYLRVDEDALCSIIWGRTSGKHGIPLVCWTAGEDVAALKVVPYEDGMKYTAISHVWVDGMGNEDDNSLPKCQVRRLFRWIEEHWAAACGVDEYGGCEDQRYLWLDTLCVPLSKKNPTSSRSGETRKHAIHTMRDVYQLARTTLVIDSYLTKSTVYARWEEKLTRITVSAWLHRMWTLQEAILSGKIFLQWAECSEMIHPEGASRLGWDQREVQNSYHNDVSYNCDKFNFSGHVLTSVGLSRLMYLMFHQLKSRTTSKPLDEAIIFATIMLQTGEPLRNLLAINDVDERLRALWRMLLDLGIPAAVLFLPGTKLAQAGYRWAPKDLSYCGFLGMPSDSGHVVTARNNASSELVGVTVRQAGLLLDIPAEAVRAVLTCRLEGKLYYIRRSKIVSNDWDDLELHKIKRLALLLAQNPAMHSGGRQDLLAAVGALVSLNKDESTEARGQSEEMEVTWLRQVSIFQAGSRYDVGIDPPWSELEEAEKKLPAINASYLPVDQAWLVT